MANSRLDGSGRGSRRRCGSRVPWYKFNGNLHAVDIDAALGKDRPANVDNGSQDILVLGSDSWAGANSEYGADEGARSDTAMVVHVYAGARRPVS
jgi:hypothetical protein